MHFFLVFVMLVAGLPSGRPIATFTSAVECAAEGEKIVAEEKRNPVPRQGYWECLGVDFDKVDPLTGGRPPSSGSDVNPHFPSTDPPRRIPGRNEA